MHVQVENVKISAKQAHPWLISPNQTERERVLNFLLLSREVNYLYKMERMLSTFVFVKRCVAFLAEA